MLGLDTPPLTPRGCRLRKTRSARVVTSRRASSRSAETSARRRRCAWRSASEGFVRPVGLDVCAHAVCVRALCRELVVAREQQIALRRARKEREALADRALIAQQLAEDVDAAARAAAEEEVKRTAALRNAQEVAAQMAQRDAERAEVRPLQRVRWLWGADV